MAKKISTAAAVVLFAGFFAWCSAPAADAPSKDTLKKAVEKAPPKAAQTAAPSPTTKAAQAFEKVSKELYPKPSRKVISSFTPSGTSSICAPSPMPS